LLWFFFTAPSPTEPAPLSLHDALPISCCAAAPRRGGPAARAPLRSGPPAWRGAAQHAGAPRPVAARSLPRSTQRALAECIAAARPSAVRARAGIRGHRGSVAARAGAPRETALAVYRIRRATAADAGVLARHRAEMFRDMGELPGDLHDTLIEAARAYFIHAIVDG